MARIQCPTCKYYTLWQSNKGEVTMGTYDTRGGSPIAPDMNDPFDPFDLITAELDRQKALPNAAQIAAIERGNTLNDRIAVTVAYLGRASEKVQRNEREGCKPVENLVKAAAVIYSAIMAEYRKSD